LIKLPLSINLFLIYFLLSLILYNQINTKMSEYGGDEMMSGLVVGTGGYSGGNYINGGNMVTENFTMVGMPLRNLMCNMLPEFVYGIITIALIIVCIFLLISYLTKKEGMTDNGHPHTQRFEGGENSQTGMVKSMPHMLSSFTGSRETPPFAEVSNQVLRMENREKEAIRALGKINQERRRRASEETSSTDPLPWGPFWNEWKQTHGMDDDMTESFGHEGGQPPLPY
jgi:hypothetical protein